MVRRVFPHTAASLGPSDEFACDFDVGLAFDLFREVDFSQQAVAERYRFEIASEWLFVSVSAGSTSRRVPCTATLYIEI